VSEVWVTIAAVAVASAAVKAAGPLLIGGRDLPPRARAVIVLLAPALLAALVVTSALADGDRLQPLDPKVAGVAAAALGLGLRAPTLVTLALAAATTAGLRALS
jgi:uncharacterized membrane protein